MGLDYLPISWGGARGVNICISIIEKKARRSAKDPLLYRYICHTMHGVPGKSSQAKGSKSCDRSILDLALRREDLSQIQEDSHPFYAEPLKDSSP